MKIPIFSSGFSRELNQYIDYIIESGYKLDSYHSLLVKFDRFCLSQGIIEPVFTGEHATEWIKRTPREASTTHYARINKIKQFLTFLSLQGYAVVVTRDIRYRPTDFQPHIYTDDEIVRYFQAVDTYASVRNRKSSIQLPVLFRLLLCCGTRINETLGIKKRHVNLADGTIRLKETKNDVERLIVLHDELTGLLRHFADKSFYLLKDDDYIFSNANGARFSGRNLHDLHVLMLEKANISYVGGGHGPRLHDWRHTFVVRSVKQMVDSGLDMYVALPILSAYLGHKTIFATEKYIRLTMSLYPYIEHRFKDKIEAIFQEVTER